MKLGPITGNDVQMLAKKHLDFGCISPKFGIQPWETEIQISIINEKD